jgi:GH24 family phage-related lysozyme (muramidase)
MKLNYLIEDWHHNAAIMLGLAIGSDHKITVQNTKQSEQEYVTFVSTWEGFSNKVYVDTTGNRTIGYGFNLERTDAKKLLSLYGLDYKKICDGSQEMSKDIAFKLLSYDIDIAKTFAKKFISNFEQLPNRVKEIIVDLSYNLGGSKFSKFVKFKAAIESSDYKLAAEELTNSKWSLQVGNRAKHHIQVLKNIE